MLALSIATLLGRRPPAEVPAGFSPSELFAASEVGVWYDPSDFSTLFENTDGTGAISTVEKPVGKMLDKSGNGFHATAANNSTARPILRSRYNLLTYSEQFDNAAWTKLNSTITANATAAPDGTTTADLITHTSTSNPEINQTATVVSGAQYTISVYVKYVDSQWFRIRAAGAIVASAWFDIQNGSTGTSTFSAVSMTNVGDGWYRITATGTTSTTSLTVAFNLSSADNSSVEVIGSADIWGAQLVANSVFPQNTYQRIAAATDYATGADFPPYLAFTTDDAMSTASIDFSGTDEMSVFAGVTKNSDAAAGTIVELSAASFSNPGAFAALGFVAGGDLYRYRSGGSSYKDATTAASAYAAPVTNVFTGLSDISADSTVLRLDGVQISSNAGDQGTGNFGNYPLYIGARNNSSVFFNGSLYSLIVRGKTSTAQEIDDTEAWVANKTGVTL